MRSRRTSGLAVLATLSIAACSGGDSPPAQGTAAAAARPAASAACDRACLIDMTKAYVAALVAGDTSGVPLAEVMTELERRTGRSGIAEKSSRGGARPE